MAASGRCRNTALEICSSSLEELFNHVSIASLEGAGNGYEERSSSSTEAEVSGEVRSPSPAPA
jgi:hypothetical protein